VPGQRIMLTGRHRFARYMFLFTMISQQGGTTLSARSYGEFPGVTGFAYRQLITGSGAHRTLVRRALQHIRQRAERRDRG
jgi:hypothetical protein